MKDLVGSLRISREQLGNGLVVMVNERPDAELIAIQGSFLAGPVFDPGRRSGLSHFVAAMMMRGTDRRTYREVIDQTESLGAGIRFYAGEDVASMQARCTGRSLSKTLEIIFDCIANPTFPQAEMEKVRGMMLTQIKEREDSTADVASRLVREMLFPKGNPYHSDPRGYEESVMAIGREDVVSFWENGYGPESTVLSFSGSVSHADLLDKVKTTSENWESRGRRRRVPSIAVRKPVKSAVRTMPMMHKSQADIAVACQTVARGHPDHYALELANTVLGRIGLMGRLGKNIRDKKGLAYYASSSYAPRMTGGYWIAYAGVNPANVDQALVGIYQEMARISTKQVSRREHADVRTNRVGSMALRLETCSGAASFMNSLEIHKLGMDFVDRYQGIIESVTREDIHRACREYIRTEEAVTAIVGPYEGEAEPR